MTATTDPSPLADALGGVSKHTKEKTSTGGTDTRKRSYRRLMGIHEDITAPAYGEPFQAKDGQTVFGLHEGNRSEVVAEIARRLATVFNDIVPVSEDREAWLQALADKPFDTIREPQDGWAQQVTLGIDALVHLANEKGMGWGDIAAAIQAFDGDIDGQEPDETEIDGEEEDED